MHLNTLLLFSSTSILVQAQASVSNSTKISNTTALLNTTIPTKTNLVADCQPRPLGHGPVPIPDTAEAFYNSKALSDSAFFAATPSNWTRSFVNQRASVRSTHYLGYAELDKYDPQYCAARCNNITKCEAINIYFERTPSVYLARECPNAPSTTVIKCVFWGDRVYLQDATNWGSKD